MFEVFVGMFHEVITNGFAWYEVLGLTMVALATGFLSGSVLYGFAS